MRVMDLRDGQTISEKIAIANKLHDRWGEALKSDPEISAGLGELSARVAASSELCLSSGVAKECKVCEEEEGGSCCGAGIENTYSPELLLINLLLGVRLPDFRSSSGSCFFLGEGGCRLSAREILCINYLCKKLQKTIPPEMRLRLQEVNGAEMDFIFLLHERIKRFIMSR